MKVIEISHGLLSTLSKYKGYFNPLLLIVLKRVHIYVEAKEL